MNIVSISVTEGGRQLASLLPYAHQHGDAAATIRERWHDVDGFVVFLAVGATVRIVGPLLADKTSDPAVVVVDEGARYAIAVAGGHQGGANDLARQVAETLGAEPVITTASEGANLPALDQLPGFVAEGDIAGVMRTWLDGSVPRVINERGWPLPAALPTDGEGPATIVVTDDEIELGPDMVVLRPPSLVLGVGSSSGAPLEDVASLVDSALAEIGCSPASVVEVPTIDLKAAEEGIVALGWPMRTFDAATLAEVEVPTPSDVVAAEVGTPSVAEASAISAGGPDAELILAKRKNEVATVAVVRRAAPRGLVTLVGLGPGDADHRTPAADRAVRTAEVIIGFQAYIDQCDGLLTPAHDIRPSPIGNEVGRAEEAIATAREGRAVAVVCSGDAGVFAMASIVCEVAGTAEDFDIAVVPGVTAALTTASRLGAPLGHDHVLLSLSDLLTPWELIEKRLHAVAEADLVAALYNPRSKKRRLQFDEAMRILGLHRPPTTPVGIVTDAGRPTETTTMTTLAELDPDLVGMTTCVIVGSSTSVLAGGRITTPRGYIS